MSELIELMEKSGRKMTLQERVEIYEEMQNFLANEIGLTVQTSKGSPLRLYDMWRKRPVDLPVAGCTEIKKIKGKLRPNPFRWTYTNGGD